MLGYCYIADAEWGAWTPTQTTPALAISQSRRAVSSLRDAERSISRMGTAEIDKGAAGSQPIVFSTISLALNELQAFAVRLFVAP